MTITRQIRRHQRTWAASRNLAFDHNGYVPSGRDNLYQPLSESFASALTAAGGGETKDQRNHPPKIRALHSSAVLAINVFQYWEERTGPELMNALGAPGELTGVSIEQQFPTGLRGTPPTLDVVLSLADDRILAIESKFTEWITKNRAKLADFASKYLAADPVLWAACNLPACQQLAADIATGAESFRHLDALQLLKHALGLQVNRAGEFALLYLYYDYDGESDIADRHRAEIERFAARVDASLGFSAMSYQALCARLVEAGDVDAGYLGYLQERYF